MSFAVSRKCSRGCKWLGGTCCCHPHGVSPSDRVPSQQTVCHPTRPCATQQTGGTVRRWHALGCNERESCRNSRRTTDWPTMTSSTNRQFNIGIAGVQKWTGARGWRPCCWWCWLRPSHSAGGNRRTIRPVSVWTRPYHATSCLEVLGWTLVPDVMYPDRGSALCSPMLSDRYRVILQIGHDHFLPHLCNLLFTHIHRVMWAISLAFLEMRRQS